MSKRTFEDALIVKTVEAARAEETQSAIENLQKFIEKKIPKEVDAYEWVAGDVLIEVFSYSQDKDTYIQVSDGLDIGNIIYLPIAKIIATSDTSKYIVGDIVRLRDSDVTTVENPKYREWVNNSLSKSNLKQKGEEPPRYGSNIVKTMGPYYFNLNPIRRNNDEMELYFKIPESRIENKIKDVQVLFNSI